MTKKLTSFSKQTLVISKKVSNLISQVHVLHEDAFKAIVQMGKVLNQLKKELDKDITDEIQLR